MKRGSADSKLARVKEIAQGAIGDAEKQELRNLLRRAQGAVVMKVALLAARRGLDELVPDLTAAFGRFMSLPAKSDSGCLAKVAIVEALNTLGHDHTPTFLQGIRHVQMEPVYGGRADTAAVLRGRCGAALARIDHPDARTELVTLLMDREVEARRSAVKALAYLGGESCELVLRVKVLAGDEEKEVTLDCLNALIEIAPEHSLEFVAGYLNSPDAALAEGAALALAETRSSEAYGILREHWDRNVDADTREMLLLPFALLRNDDGFEFLLDLVTEARGGIAATAVEALRIYRGDPARAARVSDAVSRRDDRAVTRAYAEAFPEAS